MMSKTAALDSPLAPMSLANKYPNTGIKDQIKK